MRSSARVTSSVRRRVGVYTMVCPGTSRIRRRMRANRVRSSATRSTANARFGRSNEVITTSACCKRSTRRISARVAGVALPVSAKVGGGEQAVEIRRGDSAAAQRAHLVLHQRDEGRDDERQAVGQQRG